ALLVHVHVGAKYVENLERVLCGDVTAIQMASLLGRGPLAAGSCGPDDELRVEGIQVGGLAYMLFNGNQQHGPMEMSSSTRKVQTKNPLQTLDLRRISATRLAALTKPRASPPPPGPFLRGRQRRQRRQVQPRQP
ncbi:unnamed protein product, partial [Polarella glacialis]